jgi:hypothetical protein
MTGRWMIPVVLATFFMVTNATAQSVLIFSYENWSCGKWSSWGSDALASRSRATFVAWTMGFVSGYNWFIGANQVTRKLSNETIAAYVDKYCRERTRWTTFRTRHCN